MPVLTPSTGSVSGRAYSRLSPSRWSGLLFAIVLYAVSFLVPLTVTSCWLYLSRPHIPGSLLGDPPEKAKFYCRHASEFNLVFVGDSRTYCGIHPDIIDGLLGTHSVNMANFAHWFPTQYPFFQALVPFIPSGTTVVWTIGHQNFQECSSIQRRYPIGLKNLPEYLLWGFPWTRIEDNICYYNPALYLYSQAKQWHTDLTGWSNRIVHRLMPKSANSPGAISKMSGNQQSRAFALEKYKSELRNEYQTCPEVASIWVVDDEGKVNSVILYKVRGSHYRIELDHAYFRNKQREMAQQYADTSKHYVRAPFKPDEKYWRNFIAILDLFRKYHVHLVVNEIEEAPFHYGSPLFKEDVREFMRSKVRPVVEGYGFRYVRANFDQLSDADYFDYDHLNSIGGQKYDKMLAGQLRPLLLNR